MGSGIATLNGRNGGYMHESGPSKVGPQYATLNRKFRTLEHPGARGAPHPPPSFRGVPTYSNTLGYNRKPNQSNDRQYSTLSRKCKTLESSDFYWNEPTSADQTHISTISGSSLSTFARPAPVPETTYQITEL